MQLIQCTQKLLARVAVEPEADIAVIPELNWHANLIQVYYHDCVLITYNKTLFSLFYSGSYQCGPQPFFGDVWKRSIQGHAPF